MSFCLRRALELVLHHLHSIESPLGPRRHDSLRNRPAKVGLNDVRHLADRRCESLEVHEATRGGSGGAGCDGVAADELVGLRHTLGRRVLYIHKCD